MNEQDIILLGRAIDGLVDVREILRVLVNRGVLPDSWKEIVSVMDSVRSELSDMELGLLGNASQMGAGS
jgi:hypothetical protein